MTGEVRAIWSKKGRLGDVSREGGRLRELSNSRSFLTSGVGLLVK